jgi:hypothetical protein
MQFSRARVAPDPSECRPGDKRTDSGRPDDACGHDSTPMLGDRAFDGDRQ